MAFKNNNMSVIAYVNGFTLWHYKTTEDNLISTKYDYFPKDIMDLMAIGDILIINAKDKTEILTIKKLYPATLTNLGEKND